MTVDWLEVGFKLGKFVLDNFVSIFAFAGVVKVALTQNDKQKADEAKQKAFLMAVDATKLMAQETLGTKEKRQKAIDMVLEAMPDSVKKYVTPFTVEILVEKAYTTITKPALNK